MQGPPGIDKLVLAQKGTEARLVLPIIDEEVSRMRKQIFTAVFAKLRAATLTPDEALHYWQEVYAYHRLLKNFETAITMGESAAKASPQNIPDGPGYVSPPVGYTNKGNT